MQMLVFILFTVFFMACNVGGYHFLWKATHHGEMFGAWQKVIDWLYGNNWIKLSDFLGGCRVCFGHFTSILGFIAYVAFMYNMDLYIIKGWLNVIWYLFYVAGTWWGCMMSINETKEGTE